MRPAEVGGPVASYCEQDHDPSGSLKHEKFLDMKREHWLVKTGSGSQS